MAEPAKLLTMKDVAKKWGWPTWKVTRLLVKAGCVTDLNENARTSDGRPQRGSYVTTRARVREKYPELARLL